MRPVIRNRLRPARFSEARRRVPIAIITLALSAALDVWLIQDIGLIGSAISSDVAIASGHSPNDSAISAESLR